MGCDGVHGSSSCSAPSPSIFLPHRAMNNGPRLRFITMMMADDDELRKMSKEMVNNVVYFLYCLSRLKLNESSAGRASRLVAVLAA